MKKKGLMTEDDYVFGDFCDDTVNVRHVVEIRKEKIENIDMNEVLERGKSSKVLIICNTIKKAQGLYRTLSGYRTGVRLLHSHFSNDHRRKIERSLLEFSKDSNACGIWITTQIVEASLDIDFDYLYTDMCTADSLLQRMGRCNRAGLKIITGANVIVYVSGTDKSRKGVDGIYDADIYERSVRFLEEYNDCGMTERQKRDYINLVYDVDEIKDSEYFKEIERKIGGYETIKVFQIEKGEDQKHLRPIDNIFVIPDDVYNANIDCIEKYIELMKNTDVPKNIRHIVKERLFGMTVSISAGFRYSPDGVKSCIDGTNIHRTRYKYDFDEESLTGIGLCLKELDDDQML